MIHWKHFAIAFFFCPLCDKTCPFVKLGANAISVRCLSCRATIISLSVVAVLRQIVPTLKSMHVYELSARGPLFEYLQRHCNTLTCSEYFSTVSAGDYYEGVQCQDVQQLTFQTAHFDLCTSTEVFEHVPNDTKGFSEVCRVLKPCGLFIFRVPLAVNKKTVERAELDENATVRHLLPPEYHSDPIRSHQPILAFRNYGYDILDRLLRAGFKKAELREPQHPIAWGYRLPVVVAYRDHIPPHSPSSDPSLLRSASHEHTCSSSLTS